MFPVTKNVKQLERVARDVRALIIKMLAKAGSGHPGGSLSAVEILTTLYFSVMRHDPENPSWEDRDRFHLSKGHACPVLYAVLAKAGYFDESELWNLRKFGSILQGHADRRTPGVEVSTGSLGQGLSIALGMALGARVQKKSYRVYCLLGDGEIQEGNIWEAAMAAAHYNVGNLCAILDYNKFQIDGSVDEIMSLEPIEDKWEAFGWHTIVVDGHDISDLISAFEQAKEIKKKPTIIIAQTVKGKGVSFMEHVVDFHGRAPTPEEEKKALEEILGDE